ncbi:MAG: hypothetical protein AAF749_06490 [Pseudomonadota bacterium]
MINAGFKIAVPTAPIVTYLSSLFRLGFDKRDKVFARLIHNSSPLPDPAPSNVFGYIVYPDVSNPGTPKGFKQTPNKHRQRLTTKEMRDVDSFFERAITDFELTINSEYKRLDNESFSGSAHELRSQLIYPLMKLNNPSTVLFGGKIGCGKTTLIGSLSHAISKNPYITDVCSAVLVRIDLREALSSMVDEILQGKYENPEVYIANLDRVIIALIESRLKSAGIKFNNNSQSFDDILLACKAKQSVPVFVFDELDTLYYSFCLASAASGVRNTVQLQVFDYYRKLIAYFFNISHTRLSKTLASPIVIIAARSSTLRLMSDVAKPGVNFSKPEIHFPKTSVSIARPDNERVKAIISSWIEYELVSNRRNNSSRDAIESKLLDIREALNDQACNFSKNLALSVHGLRHITKVLGKSTTVDPTLALFAEYIKKPGLLRLYQYLDGCQFYSQTAEGVSNIFLVNNDFRSPDELRNLLVPDKLYMRHLQTYWLKYIFLKYVVHSFSQNGQQPLPTIEVINLFSTDPRPTFDGARHYEKELMELIILHATEVLHGRLIKLSNAENGASTRIIPSERAILFSQEELFWEFGYLSVCVEDDWLEYPASVSGRFALNEEWKRTYNFCTRYHLLDVPAKNRFWEYKAKRVLDFVSILEVALEIERERYCGVYARLASAFGGGFNFDDYMRNRKQQVIDSIVAFAEDYVKPGRRSDYARFCTSYLRSSSHRRFVSKVRKAIHRYSRKRGSLRTIEKHMSFEKRARLEHEAQR